MRPQGLHKQAGIVPQLDLDEGVESKLLGLGFKVFRQVCSRGGRFFDLNLGGAGLSKSPGMRSKRSAWWHQRET